MGVGNKLFRRLGMRFTSGGEEGGSLTFLKYLVINFIGLLNRRKIQVILAF